MDSDAKISRAGLYLAPHFVGDFGFPVAETRKQYKTEVGQPGMRSKTGRDEILGV